MKRKKNKKKLPIGLSDFKEIIEYDYYYFDKTKFIENILEERSKVKLFTRPRRFGKTLNLSMLKYFFDVENREENKKLFEGLNISKSEYFEKQGEFPVISISFKNYNKNDWESGFKSIKSTISDIYAKFEYLMEHLNKRDLKKFEDIWLEKDEGDWERSLLNLTKYVFDYYGKKVIILIDEYDQPIINSYIKGYYSETIDFFKSFYGSVLKDNEYLEMSVITGILRVAKENIFSGLNNLEVHTILDSEFTEYFGIMEDEVEEALKDFNLEYELEDVQKWYNGYLFGDTKVYNPWSIINFLKKGRLRPYWVNTSGNGLIQLYLEKLKNEIFDEFSRLLNKENIFETINDSMTFGNLEANFEKNIWNLFFHSGYLTLAKKNDEDEEEVYLKIPNEEILKMFSKMFIEVYFRDSNNFSKFTNALKSGDIEKFKFELNKILLENTGIFDISGSYKEQFYHGLMLGLILKLRNEYEITSNGFAGKGRYDLLLKPKNILNKLTGREGIIFELKILNIKSEFSFEAIHEKLEKECEIALKQIDEKEYSSVLRNAGVKKILKIGISFLGKEFEVKFEREKEIY
ncbi:AAA family ATPase [Leptotrichia sp. oral taxon 218]|uniref:AAA family ATPase n=1 Tax=Leptotrichia sp. oral taxon 218 TaxID=712361 RepID=UPI001B8CB98B|nr:AAA family ATPase [Leptotrichia sp. oral taxon 218]QUB96013.1 AAA family ATPase [Leptotrichia sp. oral taxon 218]